jgi:hypothetical protein
VSEFRSDPLLEAAHAWVEPYWNAEHLRRTLDWLLVIEPHASQAARLAALTHDMERSVPGGPEFDPGTMAPHDEAYRKQHSERSAAIVGDWLAGHGADPALVARVRELIELHEIGGTPEADLVQAADSLSFLETNAGLVRGWVVKGRCSLDRAKQQHDRMFERIRVERARELARPLYERALAVAEGEEDR